MKIVGIVVEYNPFHRGHAYHIEQARRLTGADAVIAVMSGDFVQRGTPAVFSKYTRAEMALRGGADVVLELPVCYATASAETFAAGAVSLLDLLGCVDSLCFGCESGELSALSQVAHILTEEPEDYRDALRQALRRGDPFPLAREKAVSLCTGRPDFSALLREPNNILGIEYIKALLCRGSRITPYAIKRRGAGYHDTSLAESYSSASAIRETLFAESGDRPSLPEEQIPESARRIFLDHPEKLVPIRSKDFSLLLKYRLLTETRETLCSYSDVTEELANRILTYRNQYLNFEQFCALLKNKAYTYTRISRALLHILLAQKTSDLQAYHADGFHYYARLLGFRKDASEVLSQISASSAIPLISRIASPPPLCEAGTHMLSADIAAANLYESVVTDKYGLPFTHEYGHPMIRI